MENNQNTDKSQQTPESPIQSKTPDSSVTSDINQTVPNIPPDVVTPSEPTTPQPKRSNKLLKIGLLLIVLGLLGIGGYMLFQNQKIKDVLFPPKTTPTQNPISAETPTPNKTSDWEDFTSETLGLSFKVPSKLTKNGQLNETISNAEKGTYLCITVKKNTGFSIKTVNAGGTGCNIGSFGIQADSVGFEAGQSGSYLDLQGFEYKENKYYCKWLFGTEYEKTVEIPENIIKPYSERIIKILGKSYDEPVIWPYENQIGVIINTNSEKYPGAVLSVHLSENFTEKDLDQILSTFKLLD